MLLRLSRASARTHKVSRSLPHILAFLAVAATYLTGGLTFLDNRIAEWRFELVQRQASGKLALAAIDAASLQEIGVWPWPREVHARLLQSLSQQLVNKVVFDIDFSTPSADPDQDRRLAEALKDAVGSVILPIFHQIQPSRDGGSRMHVTQPLAQFRRYAILAVANVRPDDDGLVRRYATYQGIDGTEAITVGALLGGPRPDAPPLFAIDFGIRADTVPTYSVADILHKRLPDGTLAGRDVIIGATAIELGDQLAVPALGVLPSPYILILAAESLLQDRALVQINGVIVLIGALLIALFVGPRFGAWGWRRGAVIVGAVVVAALALSLAVQATLPAHLDVSALLVMAPLSAVVSWVRQMDRQTSLASRLAVEATEHRRILRNLADNAFEGILLLSTDGRIDYLNPAAERLFGYGAKEIVGSNVERLFGPDAMAHLADGAAPGLHETVGTHRDGQPVTVEIALSNVGAGVGALDAADSPRRLLLCSLRDVGERKRSEEDFRQRHDRMTQLSNRYSLNELAVALAHEINQPLAAISGYLGGSLIRLAERKDVPAPILGAIKSALQQAQRVAEIVGRTRKQFDATDLRLAPTDVNAAIVEAVELMKFELSNRNARVSYELAPDLPLVELDKLQFQQVINNLIRNGAEAMLDLPPDARRIVISSDRAAGDGISITVQDSGSGISAELADKIFSPFVTSKKEGSGIGLSICQAVVEKHGGTIKVASAPGEPAAFEITLPIRQGATIVAA